MEFKPNKTAFIYFRFAKITVFALVITVILSLILAIAFPVAIIFVIPLAIIYIAVNYIALKKQYEKTVYSFQENKFIFKTGGIFSDKNTELNIQNITHVNMNLPWIENKFFKTGHINIESAGSARAEVRLTSIDQSETVYKEIEERMKQNGFALTKAKLIQEEIPSVLGVFFECFKKLAGGIFGFFFFILAFAGESFIRLLSVLSDYLFLAFFGIFLVVFYLFINALISFFDLKNRKYFVYNDTIVYEEGFLNRHYAYIPIENLTDTIITQNIIDRIFNLYDLVISCQGSQQEIHFKNMEHGQELKDNIDKLIKTKKPAQNTIKTNTTTAKTVKKQEKPKLTETAFESTLSMNPMRTIIPTLPLIPLFFIWIPLAIRLGIMIACTTYHVNKTSIEEHFEFFNSKKKEYTLEKITGVVVKRNFLDNWFNTVTIQFWSIGASESIAFTNIKNEGNILNEILEKLGFSAQTKSREIKAEFSFGTMLKAQFPMFIFGTGLFLVFLTLSIALEAFFSIFSFVVIVVGIIILVRNILHFNTHHIQYAPGQVIAKKGLIFKEAYYVKNHNIKDLVATKYPLSNHGILEWNVAGEHVVQQGQGNVAFASNNFSMHYLPDVHNLLDFFDQELNGSPLPKETLHTSKPSLMNPLIVLIGASVIIFPLVAFLPFTLTYAILSVRARSYALTKQRALSFYGIIYKTKATILFSKIDHIKTDQGVLNKMCRNGNVLVHTQGSSKTEMAISNINDFQAFKEKMQY